MKISKDLVHVIDFSKAPNDVREAARQQQLSAKRLQKARVQLSKWRDEVHAAIAEETAAYETLEKLSASWSGDAVLEDAPVAAAGVKK